jgi:hypothetical protein
MWRKGPGKVKSPGSCFVGQAESSRPLEKGDPSRTDKKAIYAGFPNGFIRDSGPDL